MKSIDTWCCSRIADVIRNGESTYEEIEEEISTEVSGGSDSESHISGKDEKEEEEVVCPDARTSIFTEAETQGIHEGLVYEKRLIGAIVQPTSIWPSTEWIRSAVGGNTASPVIGRTEVTKRYDGQEITVTALAGEITYESTVEETYLNHLKDIKVTLKVVNLNCPRKKEKADFGEDARVVTMRGEAVMVAGEHRASGEFSSGQFWSMETFALLGHQKDLKIDIQSDDTVSKWQVDTDYLHEIMDNIMD
jgi:hypothetical protein